MQVERNQIEQDLTSAKVTNDPDRARNLFNIHEDPYEAVKGSHAIVVLTEWDEFKVSYNKLSY